MILYDNALRYWMIAKRFHAHRQFQGMRPVAVNDMTELLPAVQGQATRKRVEAFIARHQTASPTPPPPLRTA